MEEDRGVQAGGEVMPSGRSRYVPTSLLCLICAYAFALCDYALAMRCPLRVYALAMRCPLCEYALAVRSPLAWLSQLCAYVLAMRCPLCAYDMCLRACYAMPSADTGDGMHGAGQYDVNGSQLDLRKHNSWLLKLHQVSNRCKLRLTCNHDVTCDVMSRT
eukprot:1445877-Rhodomonas_salina.2